jgi:hypothetical protein
MLKHTRNMTSSDKDKAYLDMRNGLIEDHVMAMTGCTRENAKHVAKKDLSYEETLKQARQFVDGKEATEPK